MPVGITSLEAERRFGSEVSDFMAKYSCYWWADPVREFGFEEVCAEFIVLRMRSRYSWLCCKGSPLRKGGD